MKRPIKDGHYDTSKRCEISCYTPQLCDRIEKVNQHNKQLFVPSIKVRKESFWENLYPPDFLSCDPEIKESPSRKICSKHRKVNGQREQSKNHQKS